MSKVRTLLIGYGVIALATAWPILSVAIAGSIASWNNCELHEGFKNDCIVGGNDIAGTLYTMGMMGWFMIATLPLGAIAFVVWTLIWGLALRRRKKSVTV